MKFQLLATALACCASLASFGASAQETPPAAYDGAYIIEILPPSGAHPAPNCMAFDGGLVRTQRFGNGALCGYTSLAANEAAKATVWDVTRLMHNDGRIAYTIRNRVNGQCMVRGHNGDENTVRFHMWSANNPALCGFPSPEAVIDHGQAAWQFDEEPQLGPNFVSNIRTLRNGVAYLSFTTATSLLLPGRRCCTPTTCSA